MSVNNPPYDQSLLEFWKLFDRAFSSLYSSNETSRSQKDTIIFGIDSVISNLKEWKFMNDSKCSEFYIWLIHHFCQLLLNHELRPFYEKITVLVLKLVKALSQVNPVLFNGVFRTFISVINFILNEMKTVPASVNFCFNVSQDIFLPDAIKNKLPSIYISPQSSVTSLLNCFAELCKEVLEDLLTLSTHHLSQIITVLRDIVNIQGNSEGIKVIFLLASKAIPLLTVKEWRELCQSLQYIPVNSDLVTAYTALMENISCMKSCQDINLILFGNAICLLTSLCESNASSDIQLLLVTMRKTICRLPNDNIKLLNLKPLIIHLTHIPILFDIFEEYLKQSLLYFISSNESKRDSFKLSNIDDVWWNLINLLNCFIESTLKEKDSRLKKMKNILKIYSIATNIKPVAVKHDTKVILFESVTDSLFKLFTLCDTSVEPEVIWCLVELSKMCIFILQERESIDTQTVRFFFSFLYTPWEANSSMNWDTYKSACYDGLLTLLHGSCTMKVTSFMFKIADIVFCIAKKEESFRVPFIYTMCQLITYSDADVGHKFYHSFLKPLINKESIKLLLLSSVTRNILPCFFAGHCSATVCHNGLSLNCKVCDSFNINSNLPVPNTKCLQFIGYNYLQLLLLPDTAIDTKVELLSSLDRYAYHIDELKLKDNIIMMSQCIGNLLLLTHFPIVPALKCFIINNEDKLEMNLVNLIINEFWQIFCKETSFRNIPWVISFFDFLIYISRHSKNFVFTLIKMLIAVMFHCQISNVQVSCLKEKIFSVASFHDLEMKHLITRHEYELSEIIVYTIIYNIKTKKCGIENTLNHISKLFNMNIKYFLSYRCTNYLITNILMICDLEQSLEFINHISGLLDIKSKDLIIKGFPVIFSEIYFHDYESVTVKALRTVEVICEGSIESLVYITYKDLICDIIMNAHKPLKVIRFFELYTSASEAAPGDISEILLNYAMGFLTVIDAKLSSKSSSNHIVKLSIRSIPNLVKLLGPGNINAIRIKLLATLRTGLPLHYDSFPQLCLEAWLYFIYCVECSFWGPYLTTIFKLLLPLFNRFPEDIVKTFSYLVVKNGNLYPDYIPELFFVNESPMPVMHEVWDLIKNSTKKLNASDILQTTLTHIRSGVMESRIHSLNYLHHVLKMRRQEILMLIHLNDQLPAIFNEIVNCLMQNLHYGTLDVKIICTKCLGELGAINPAKFGYNRELEDLQSDFFNVQSTSFANTILFELLKALQKSTDSHAYNTIASSIQELIKILFPTSEQEKLYQFIDTFDEKYQDILKSMIGSRYIFSDPVILKRRHEKVGSISGKSTFEWASLWAAELIALMPNDSPERKVFKTSLPALKLDFEALEAILPHILLHAILTCSQEDETIVETDIKYTLGIQEQDFLGPPQDINLVKYTSKNSDISINSEITEEKCVALVLNLIDFLYKYENFLKLSKSDEEKLEHMTNFLKKFAVNFISLKAYCLKDYSRSLYYMEKYLKLMIRPRNLAPLRNIYAKLNDADGLHGAIKVSQNIPTAEEDMVNHIVCGNIQEALPAYELMAWKHPESTEFCRGLVQCYLNTNCQKVAFSLATEYSKKSSPCGNSTAFSSEIVEAACRNLAIDKVEIALNGFDDKMKTNWSWGIDLSMVSVSFIKQNFDSMRQKIDSIRSHIAERLAAISNTPLGTYRQGYNHVVILHVLNDIEKYAYIMENHSKLQESKISQIFKDMLMDSRLRLLPSSGSTNEQVISLRIHTLSLMYNIIKSNSSVNSLSTKLGESIRSELGSCYLEAAKISRKKRNLSIAKSYLALAEEYKPQGLFVEKAKFHKAIFEVDTAICILREGVEEIREMGYSQPTEIRKLSSMAKLLIVRYNVENLNVDYEEAIMGFKDSIFTFSCEKNYRCLAQYQYSIHSKETAPDSTKEKCQYQIEALKNFAKSLEYGCKYLYQSMSCMVSLWLDFGLRYKKTMDATAKNKQQPKYLSETVHKMNEIIRKSFKKLPKYMFMAVFSQLLSRINHPLIACQELLINIIANVAVKYPHQAFWLMSPIWKIKDGKSNKIFEAILEAMKAREAFLKSKNIYYSEHSVAELFSAYDEFIEILISICTKRVAPHLYEIRLTMLSSKLKPFLKTNKVPIMIPAQKFRTISLPMDNTLSNSESHCAFPKDVAYFVGADETVEVLRSLQRPKKVVFKGSDGELYPFMCKPMDDLRLDSRVMEFCSVVNMYLQRDPESSDRNLHIKTYSVVPLNSTTGLIEWVPNLIGFRTAIYEMYEYKNISPMCMSEVKKQFEKCESITQRVDLYEDVLLPSHPPVLSTWFEQQFPTPDAWHLAKKTFVRSVAVMSIVGYMVGLGDRHGENILLDKTTGAIMHVDFNCLFGRGGLFQIPEVVPFRLTRNMIDAMGPTGIQGHFRIACEITARVIRDNAEQLFHVLKPFLYDLKLLNGPKEDEKTKNEIYTIQKKMSGCVITPKQNTPPLSVEGQVNCLIYEATKVKNLGSMFYGWTPFL